MSASQTVVLIRCLRPAPSAARARSSRARHSRACSSTGRPAAVLPRAVTPGQKISFAPPPSGTTRAGEKSGLGAAAAAGIGGPSLERLPEIHAAPGCDNLPPAVHHVVALVRRGRQAGVVGGDAQPGADGQAVE